MTKYPFKAVLFYLPLVAKDAAANRACKSRAGRILITRYAGKRSYVHRDFLAWVSRHVPQLRRLMEFRRLPCRVDDWTRYALHVSWAGDGLDLISPAAHRRARRIADQCRGHGVGLINPVDLLANTGKSRGAGWMRSAGVRVPRCVAIRDVAQFRDDLAGLEFPLLLREERGHGRPSILVESRAELKQADLSKFASPVAAEFVDTRSPDGLYRKYRCILAGDVGVARHMIVNDHWEVRPQRRVTSAALVDEELAFVSAPPPHHHLWTRARCALGLDVVGFDYSLDSAGKVVVWEANAFTNLNFPRRSRAGHVWPAVRRSFAAVARLYLERAGASIPDWIDRYLDGYASRTTTVPAPPRRLANHLQGVAE